jgi:citrate synthase
MTDEVQYLTAQEAAEYLGVSRATLYAYVSRGLVASEPGRGRERRYSLESLDARRRGGAGLLGSGAPVLDSSLTLIDRDRLWYRGRDVRELSRTASVEEVACLLWTGSTGGARDLFPRASSPPSKRVKGTLADRLVACLVEERAQHPVTLGRPGTPTLRSAAATVSALFDAAGAVGSGSLAKRLARGWSATKTSDIRAALILCADHELNTSAFTVRCVASTDAPIQNALLAGLCALEGRRHGGVTREVDDLLDDVERLGVDPACRRWLGRTGRLPGFTAAVGVYPGGDPRALELLRRLALPPEAPAAQAIAFAETIGALPTIDLALCSLARKAALPPDAAFGLFALGRSVGWVAHALEEAASGSLIRPRARYTGPAPAS